MKRDIYETLCKWKDEPNRRPLLIRGARQTGKTYIVNEFGQKEFTSIIGIYRNWAQLREKHPVF